MAKRQIKQLFKRSNVAGKVPSTGDLLLGEVALNTSDGIMWTSGTTQNDIIPIGWDRVSRTGDTMTGPLTGPSFSATTFSGGTYYGDGSNLSGITSTDYYVTGGTVNQSNDTLTLTRNDNNNIIITGITKERQILDIYQSGTTTTAGSSYSDIIWDVVIVSDSDYSISGPEITFNTNGWYCVDYTTSIDINSGGRKTSRSRLVLDTGSGYSEIIRSGVYAYHRSGVQGQDSASKKIRQFFNSGDKIKTQISRFTGGGTLVTIANDSNITINKEFLN